MSAFPSLAPASVLASGVVVKGEIQSQEALIIEGEVEGTIEMPQHRLTIAGSGRVRASVAALEIEVHGRFDGQAEADGRMRLARSAEVLGDIYAGSLVIEDGAFIKGKVELSSADGARE